MMFRTFKRRDDRKLRISSWFARERDRDMHSFDVDGITSGIGVYLGALQREAVIRRAARAAAPVA
ncbi:MAG: hypothetical protein ACOH1E_05100 [Brevundimonas sp.]